MMSRASLLGHSRNPRRLTVSSSSKRSPAMRDGTLRHTGHRELRRHVLNAIARSLPGDQRRFDRPSTSRNTKAGRQERRVIDCLTAASMVPSSTLADMLAAPPARVRAIDLSTV